MRAGGFSFGFAWLFRQLRVFVALFYLDIFILIVSCLRLFNVGIIGLWLLNFGIFALVLIAYSILLCFYHDV